jgi:hypothetical protein
MIEPTHGAGSQGRARQVQITAVRFDLTGAGRSYDGSEDSGISVASMQTHSPARYRECDRTAS